jgi:hypothetical protein
MNKKTKLKRDILSKTITWVFLFGAITLFLYTFQRAEIVYDGERWSVYKKYYLISVISIVFFALVLRFKTEIRLNIIMVSVSALFGIYLLEVMTSVVLSSGKKGDRDVRTSFQVYSDLIDNGIDAVPSIRPNIFLSTGGILTKDNTRLYPLSGVSKKITVYCNESGERIVYKSDKHGFRNSNQNWDLKEKVWIVIGDSFAHGACVHDDEHAAARVQSLKQNYSVINLGIGGSGPLIELAILKEYASVLKPKVILWFYFEGNDLVQNLKHELNSSVLKNYLRPGYTQNLLTKQHEIDESLNSYIKNIVKVKNTGILSKLETIVQNSGTLRLLHIRRLMSIKNETWDPLGKDLIIPDEFLTILKTAQATASQWGGEVYFVYLPELSRYLLQDRNNFEFRERGKVLKLVASIDMPIIDIHNKVFESHADPLSLFPGRTEPHFTAEGYKLVGEALVSQIKVKELGN